MALSALVAVSLAPMSAPSVARAKPGRPGVVATASPASAVWTDAADGPVDAGTGSANDARHAIPRYDERAHTAPLMLGETIDAEPDRAVATPDRDGVTRADGDDAAGVDDEDAVPGPIRLSAGKLTTVPVKVTNTTDRPATLAAWADLNGNDTYERSERITANVPASSATTVRDLTFGSPLPVCQAVRFRIFPGEVADPMPTGAATGGEVEDHFATVALAAESKQAGCADGDVARSISGVAQAWTPDSKVQTFAGNSAQLAVDGPDNRGVQLSSGQSSVLTLDLATVVPAGNVIKVHLAQASASYSGPVQVSSSAGGTEFGGAVDFTPTTVTPSFTAFDYVVPAGGARYVQITPRAVNGAASAVRVDAVTYAFEYCECENTVNLVKNGGFEEFAKCSLQTGTFGAWKVIEHSNHIWGSTCNKGWASPEGVNSLDLDGAATGGVEQTISGLTPGNRYNLTFYLAFNPAAGASSSSTRVSIGDFTTVYTSASNAIRGGFNLVHAEFTADSASELLRFESLTGDKDPALLNGGGTSGYGVVLDDVRITPKDCTELRQLTISKSADPAAEIKPGGLVTYTVTVTNTGLAAYTAAAPASFTDDLSGVLDDAVYNNDASSTTGTVSFASPVLSWSGALAPGAAATITYRVTVGNPPAGDRTLRNVVVGPPESNCGTGSTDPGCTTTTPIRALEMVKAAGTTSAQPGDTVTYTITITNIGAVAYTASTVSDDLAGVLDDAVYNNDAAATSGAVNFASPKLSWTGDVPVGATVTITYSVTINNPPGGDKTLGNVVTGPPGSNCPAGSTDPRCAPVVPMAALAISKSAKQSSTPLVSGGTVTYTVTVTNTGTAGYPGASLVDDLSGVLDDATYNGDAVASGGSVSFTSPKVSWTGDVAAGQTVTITYSVTVNGTMGDGRLTNAVAGPPDSTCPPGSTDPACTSTTAVARLEILKSADVNEAIPGTVVTYTVTVTNTGAADYAGATLTDDLTKVLDDAAYNNDGRATSGTVAYGEPTLTWTGDVPAGQTVTLPYSVTVDDPVTGDHRLPNAVVGPPGSNCPAGTVSAACTSLVGVPSLAITKTAVPSANPLLPGGTVAYTITIENTGQGTYHDASVTDDMTGILDDATYNNDAAATGGPEPTFTHPKLHWTGTVGAGETVTITYTVTVTDPPGGDGALTNTVLGPIGSDCTAGSPNPHCTTTIDMPKVDVVKAADKTSALPGEVVTYTVTVTNTGTAAYPGASLVDDLSAVLDDAAYNGDAVASGGSVSFASPKVTWSGDVAAGATVTITYSVTVNTPDTGDHTLVNAVTGPPGSNCRPGSTDPACTTPKVGVPDLTIRKVNDAAGVQQLPAGATITYTVTVSNTGTAAYPGASVRDDLTGVLDDATYNDDAAATSGTTTYLSPLLTWTGDVATGQTVTITYSVTVNTPDTGDHILINAVTGPPGSDCPAGNPCTTSVPDADVRIAKAADRTTAHGGEIVTYVVTVRNVGTAPYPGVRVSDDLTDVLDDAVYNADPTDGGAGGSFSYTQPTLSWTGDVPAGGEVTLTYSVTVGNPHPAGDGSLGNVVTGPPGSGCAVGARGPECSSIVDAVRRDFGDHPDQYQTTAADGGPYHQIVSTLRLGQAVTAELTGRPSAGSDADGADDGVLAVRGITAGSNTVSVDVAAVNTGDTDATLVAWIDFDADGDHEPVEMIMLAVPARSGTNTYTMNWTVTMPPSGIFHLRLRLFGTVPQTEPRVELAAQEAAGPFLPTGDGGAGEVEDYRYEIAAQAPPAAAIPTTGAPIGRLVLLGGAVIVAGLMFVTGAWFLRRREQP